MDETLIAAAPDASQAGAEAFVSIVIPVYNEQGIIEQNLGTLSAFFDRVVGPGRWLFILVENGSTDRTPALVEAALKRWPPSRAIHLDEPNYGAALKAGLRAVRTRWAYILDVEQWDLPFIAWAWKNRDAYDALVASKRADPTICHQRPYRRLLSCALNGLLQVLVQFTGTDTHGPKLLDCRSLRSIIDISHLDRGQYDTELMLRAMRAGKRIVEVPVLYREMRPHRNLMIKKIVWNLFALRRLVHVMKDVPFEGYVRYYRLGREDVLSASSDMLSGALEYDRV